MSTDGGDGGRGERPLVMGIVNVTPDSFSDGGRFIEPDAAIEHGLLLFSEGADIVDVGGESTRPGATPVSVDEELARVVTVVEALARHGRVSIDTRKPEVAEACVTVGADLINDVSASLHEVAAATGVGWVAMHMAGQPATMQDHPRYDDVVTEIGAFLAERARRARQAGVEEVWLDPGLGFGKTTGQNLTLLHRLPELVAEGSASECGIMIGASRKRSLAEILSRSDRTEELPGPGDRLEGSIGVAVWAMTAGAGMVRVHDVGPTVEAASLLFG